MTVLASYTTDSDMTVTDDQGVQHVLFVRTTGIIISLSRGTDASQSAAVKPTIPDGSIALCDILLDRTTAVGSLDGDQSRRPKCPPDELREEGRPAMGRNPRVAGHSSSDELAIARQRAGRPDATSTDSLQVDATWAAGTDARPAHQPSTKSKFRWRQAGENWADSRTTTLGDVQEYSFDVPDADSDVQMQVQYGNENGFGEWSDTGTIDAGDIAGPPRADDARRTTRRAAHSSDVAEYPQSTRARVTITGGSGGGWWWRWWRVVAEIARSGGPNHGGGAGGGPNGAGRQSVAARVVWVMHHQGQVKPAMQAVHGRPWFRWRYWWQRR